MKLHYVLFSVAPPIHSDHVGWSCYALQFNHQPCRHKQTERSLLVEPQRDTSGRFERLGRESLSFWEEMLRLFPEIPTFWLMHSFYFITVLSRMNVGLREYQFHRQHCCQAGCESAGRHLKWRRRWLSYCFVFLCFCLFGSTIQVRSSHKNSPKANWRQLLRVLILLFYKNNVTLTRP